MPRAKTGGGSRKGIPNKRSFCVLDEIKKINGITPAQYLLNLLQDETKSTTVRAAAAKELMPYCYSKMPQMIETPQDSAVTVIIKDFTGKAKHGVD